MIARSQRRYAVSSKVMRFVPKFLLSAMAPAHFPGAAKTYDAPEVAFLGRSNVGKSSLINALLGSKEAKVSSTPGRTRAINFFALHEGTTQKFSQRPSLIFADLPGYGYAKISKSISAEWPTFIEPYLNERDQLALCVCLVDTNIPPQANDTQLITALRQMQRPHVVVGTKADRLGGNQLTKSIAALKKAHGEDRIIPVSSKTEDGMKALWAEIVGLVH
jgi:GTP-binding protein